MALYTESDGDGPQPGLGSGRLGRKNQMRILFVFRNFHGNLRDVRRLLSLGGHQVLFVTETRSVADPPDFPDRLLMPRETLSKAQVADVFQSFDPDLLVQRNLGFQARLFWREAQGRGVRRIFYDQDPSSIPTVYSISWPIRGGRFLVRRAVTRVLLGRHTRVTPVRAWGLGSSLKDKNAFYLPYPGFRRDRSVGIADDVRPTIVTVAKIGQPRKRLHWLVRALEELQIPCRLVVIGFRQQKAEYLRNRALFLEDVTRLDSHGIEVTVLEDLGPAEIRAAYRSASIFVLPSIKEPFAISPLEAMQHGVPVLVGSDGGAVSYVAPTGREQIFAAASFRSFKSRLKFLIEDPEARVALSENIRQHLESNHSPRAFFRAGDAIWMGLSHPKISGFAGQ